MQTGSLPHHSSDPQTKKTTSPPTCDIQNFPKHISERFGLGNSNRDLLDTPYCPVLANDSLLKSTLFPFKHFVYIHHYQILVGILIWLDTRTHPYLTPFVDFLLVYNHHPSLEHLKSSLYSLQYIHLTPDIGVNFSYVSAIEPYTQILHLFPHDKEAYIGVSAPTPTSQHKLTGYSDTCWRSQVESMKK